MKKREFSTLVAVFCHNAVHNTQETNHDHKVFVLVTKQNKKNLKNI